MENQKISMRAGIGLVVGVIIGSVTDNIGLCFGAGIGTVLYKKSK
jgi:hypothetical protein